MQNKLAAKHTIFLASLQKKTQNIPCQGFTDSRQVLAAALSTAQAPGIIHISASYTAFSAKRSSCVIFCGECEGVSRLISHTSKLVRTQRTRRKVWDPRHFVKLKSMGSHTSNVNIYLLRQREIPALDARWYV